MNFTVLHIGSPKEDYFRQAFLEYQKRLSAKDSLEDVAVKPAKTGAKELSASEICEVLKKEGEELKKILASKKYERAYKIALCIEGKMLSSEELAARFEEIASSGKSEIVFLIGSSWGLDESVKAMCDLRLSFSRMTFAHSLFRVMLAEQIYRAESIRMGGKYHK